MNEIDLHVHTVASGHAFNTLEEYADCAEKKGMKAIAITDHGPNLKGSSQSAYFSVLCYIVPETMGSVRILKGIEANILDTDGTLDVPFHAKQKLDLVLTFLHPFTAYRDGGERANTKAILSAFERNPCIDILVHPLASWFPVDVKEIVQNACAHGIAIELNENMFRSQKIEERKIACMVETTLSVRGMFVVSSDAHHVSVLGNDTFSREIIRKYAVPESSILNNSLTRVLDFIAVRKELKQQR
jgi:putative hydrolase